jgi:hypothetical protein
MPPVCRAAPIFAKQKSQKTSNPDDENNVKEELSPRALLITFLNTGCDALASQWGKTDAPRFLRTDNDPVYCWLEALFSDDPTVKASPAPLQALANSHRLWMRNLHIAGDATFRIAFRLEAPAEPSTRSDWHLHYLLQARDDPSLLISAGDVWKNTGNVLPKLGHRFDQPQEKLLAGLGYAARLFPPVTESLKGKRPSLLALDTGGLLFPARDCPAV